MIQIICCQCGKTWEKEGYSGGIASHSYCDDCKIKVKAEIAEERLKSNPRIVIPLSATAVVRPGTTPEGNSES